MKRWTSVAVIALLTACHAGSASNAKAPVAARLGLYDPAHDLGPLFAAVQNARVFPDSKTFVDARPLSDPTEIARAYEAERGKAGFDLRAFVASHFAAPASATVPTAVTTSDTAVTMEAHIRALWPLLTRKADVPDPRSSLIPLPEPYVVPGGRFREVYYWDSYFTMLGLVESGRTDLVQDMLDNFAHLVQTIGHVPNGNRTYYLGRSQPPYFAAMVGALRIHHGYRTRASLSRCTRARARVLDGRREHARARHRLAQSGATAQWRDPESLLG